jgi:DNA anti-recombination protein RmuC
MRVDVDKEVLKRLEDKMDQVNKEFRALQDSLGQAQSVMNELAYSFTVERVD